MQWRLLALQTNTLRFLVTQKTHRDLFVQNYKNWVARAEQVSEKYRELIRKSRRYMIDEHKRYQQGRAKGKG